MCSRKEFISKWGPKDPEEVQDFISDLMDVLTLNNDITKLTELLEKTINLEEKKSVSKISFTSAKAKQMVEEYKLNPNEIETTSSGKIGIRAIKQYLDAKKQRCKAFNDKGTVCNKIGVQHIVSLDEWFCEVHLESYMKSQNEHFECNSDTVNEEIEVSSGLQANSHHDETSDVEENLS